MRFQGAVWLMLMLVTVTAPAPARALELELEAVGSAARERGPLFVNAPRPVLVLPLRALPELDHELARQVERPKDSSTHRRADRVRTLGELQFLWILLGVLYAAGVAAAYSRHRPSCRPMLYGLAGLVGWSRVATGDHWPSDVAAGAALGITLGQ